MIDKAMLKSALGRALSRDTLEKFTEYAIAQKEPSVSVAETERITPEGKGWDALIARGRETLWTRTLEHLPSKDVLYLEFGVHKGESIRYFTRIIPSPNSRFYGFDSFEGLPETWRGTGREVFDVAGAIPKIDDPRVEFVRGWFQDTLPGMLDRLERESQGRSLLVHFDADLYSSTLYLLFELGIRFKRFHFVFDEYSGHETRALFNYIQATGARAKFFYRLDWEGCPQVVSGELTSRAG